MINESSTQTISLIINPTLFPFTKAYHTDLDLELPELDGTRSLFVAIYDAEHPDSFLACARLRNIETKVARAAFTHQGVSGNVEFSQVTFLIRLPPYHTSNQTIYAFLAYINKLLFGL